MQNNWWNINTETLIDTPFLAVYEDRMQQNIESLIAAVHGAIPKLRPHIKTHKIGEVLELFKKNNIDKIKCATIAEAELGAMYHISDILLSYQPVGLKKQRWINLIQKYPNSKFSTIVDNLQSAKELDAAASEHKMILTVYLDLNTGMNRTGFSISEDWIALSESIMKLENLNFVGFHIYDGQVKGKIEDRNIEVATTFKKITSKIAKLEEKTNRKFLIVAGGSNTFPFYATQENVECSPGTFVFWDVNYSVNLPEQDFKTAAVLVGTIISKPTANTYCIDIGYKSVASENPMDKRLVILTDDKLIPMSHSEEHLVLENQGANKYNVGDTIYALPYHVCPTCNLYETVQVINDKKDLYTQWKVLARNKKISI